MTATYYCPFCGEDTIRPTDPPAALSQAATAAGGDPIRPAGSWFACESCTRRYSVVAFSARGAVR